MLFPGKRLDKYRTAEELFSGWRGIDFASGVWWTPVDHPSRQPHYQHTEPLGQFARNSIQGRFNADGWKKTDLSRRHKGGTRETV